MSMQHSTIELQYQNLTSHNTSDLKSFMKNKEVNTEDMYMNHKNIPCIIVGSGHTMYDFDYKNFKGIVIIAGSTIFKIRNIIKPDYLLTSNNHMPIPYLKQHTKFLNKHKNLTWIMSDTGCFNTIWDYDEVLFKKNIKIKYSFFDDRHFKNKECSPKKKCCDFLNKYPNRKMIYDQISKKFNTKYHFKKVGVSVSDIAISYAILFGCNPIFIQGVDLPLKNYVNIKDKYYGVSTKEYENQKKIVLKDMRKRYFIYYLKNLNFKPYIKSITEKIYNNFTGTSVFSTNFKNSISIMRWIRKIAEKRRVKIYVLSKNSSLIKYKLFDYLSYEGLQKKYSKFFKKNKLN